MLQPHNERVVEFLADALFVVDDILFLVLLDEFFGDGFEGIEFSIQQASNQVHLAEPPDRKAFDYLVLIQRRG